ncbi:MAG: PEP-CTERM sorting domain-containing protein [Planctomycetes bacterium]|nr:PEP-CTERM sorting domain-containing protein [Planctomycetota bacterium]
MTDYTARSVVRINGNATRSANLDTTTAPVAPTPQPTIPEPGTVLLLGTALLGMGWFRSHSSRAE